MEHVLCVWYIFSMLLINWEKKNLIAYSSITERYWYQFIYGRIYVVKIIHNFSLNPRTQFFLNQSTQLNSTESWTWTNFNCFFPLPCNYNSLFPSQWASQLAPQSNLIFSSPSLHQQMKWNDDERRKIEFFLRCSLIMNTQQEQRYIWDVSNPRVHTEIFVCIYFSRYIHTTTGGVPWHYRKCMTRFTPLRDRRCTLCVSTKEIQFN